MPRAVVEPVFVSRQTAAEPEKQARGKLPRGVFRIKHPLEGYYYYWQEGRSKPAGQRSPIVRLPDDPTSAAFREAVSTARRLAGVADVEDTIPSRGQGYVYFLVSGAYVKIGFSTKPAGRLSALATGIGSDIDAFVLIKGNRTLEKRLHLVFRAHRTQGEWFKRHAKIMKAVAAAAIGELNVETP